MRTLRLLLGSIAVYIAVACGSAISGPLRPSPDAGLPDDAYAPWDTGSVLDALTDPVPEAMAAPPLVVTENCSKQFTNGPNTYVYAEHAFSGYTKNGLAQVVAVGHYIVQPLAPASYADTQQPALLRDGYAAVVCGQISAPFYDSVTFVLPQ